MPRVVGVESVDAAGGVLVTGCVGVERPAAHGSVIDAAHVGEQGLEATGGVVAAGVAEAIVHVRVERLVTDRGIVVARRILVERLRSTAVFLIPVTVLAGALA